MYREEEPGRERYEFRGRHPDLDAWAVIAFDWKPYDPSRYGSGYLEQLEAQGLLEEWPKIFK